MPSDRVVTRIFAIPESQRPVAVALNFIDPITFRQLVDRERFHRLTKEGTFWTFCLHGWSIPLRRASPMGAANKEHHQELLAEKLSMLPVLHKLVRDKFPG